MRGLAIPWKFAAAAALLAAAPGLTGCHALRRHVALPCAFREHAHAGLSAREEAEQSFQRAAALERAGDEACVDWYFAATRQSWQAASEEGASSDGAAAWDSYNQCLAALLHAACQFGRLGPARGLVVRAADQVMGIPVVQHGFPWQPDDFQHLGPPPTGRDSLLQRRYQWTGVGVPLVVQRRRDNGNPIEARFFPEQTPFAATAVLRFGSLESSLAEGFSAAAPAVLEFYDPLRCRSVRCDASNVPLAADLSAPLAAALAETPRTYFAGFIEPGLATTSARLNFYEPYQPGKVPVVVIHGLFSDPQSWADMTNDLRAVPGFAERFQVWVFRYPTGQGFLQSAAALRTELRAAREMLDPEGRDPALTRMVLVGHSMGGLIAKLQVTHSEDRIWSQLANRPLEEIVTTEATRGLLAETCFFDPAPHVSRVVFIASPHGGSLASSGLIGQGAALLVEPSPQQEAMLEQLLADNPGTFNPLLQRRFPTSIDMLTPRSPLLEVMRQMRIGPSVKLHNLIGVSHPLSLAGPSDGVVSVKSAEHPCCQSVLAIGAPHAKVHRTIRASAEILRVLNEHWLEQAASQR